MPIQPTRRTPGQALHVIQRGRGRAPCFSCEGDRLAYRHALACHAGRSGCAVHAYVLMGNHVHLLLTPSRADAVSCLLDAVNDQYSRHVREAHDCSLPLWDDRVEVRPVYPRRYLLGCMRYIELNPVRAGLVVRPDEYRWSSFGSNALGIADALVTPHTFYYALGRSSEQRQAAYRALFQGGLLRQAVARYRIGCHGDSGGGPGLPGMAHE